MGALVDALWGAVRVVEDAIFVWLVRGWCRGFSCCWFGFA